MRAGFPFFFFIILSILLILDLYAFRGIRLLINTMQPWARTIINSLYWAIPLIIIVITIYIGFHLRESVTTRSHKLLYFMMGLMVAVYIPKIVFIVFQLSTDILRITGHVIHLFHPRENISSIVSSLTGALFFTKIGIVVAIIPFISIIHGITWGRFNYKVKNIKLEFNNLPPAFNGFKILQLSDWHIGSFLGQEDKVKESVELITGQQADMIVFTGDFVNNVADELEPFVPMLREIHAPYGKFSVLGNHDYGEYVPWENEEAHSRNMNKLFQLEENAGFTLLKNESVVISKGADSIGLCGVENWGIHPFPQYGQLSVALQEINNLSFKVLLSHDPSHWDAEVLKSTDIGLTLSGHTHGFQFGINIPGFKWSPVQYKYPRWSGLYQEGNQYLYVNVGIGYIAFPGRVGFMPEITIFELVRKE